MEPEPSILHRLPAINPAGGTHLDARPPRSPSPARRARRLGLTVAAVGVLDVVSAFTPGLRERVEAIGALFTPGVPDIAAGATAILGLGLILLGRGLAQRRRIAYVFATASLGVSAVAHLLKGSFISEAVVSLVVLGVLVANRRVFTVRPCPRHTKTVAFFLPSALGLTLVYGVIGLVLERGGIRPSLTVGLALREVAARLVGLTGPLALPRHYVWLPDSLTVLGALIVVAVSVRLLSPVAEQHLDRASERGRIRPMVERPDGDTLDPFALRADKCYVFSPDGRAAIAYRYVNGVGLGSGDPVGEPDAFRGAIGEFLALCDRNGWRPGIMGVRDERLPLCAETGLRSHYLGDEAVIDVGPFTLDGRTMRPVRQAYNRAANFGLTTEIRRERDLPEALRRDLIALSVRARGRAPERGFSMALDGLLTGRDGDCLVIITREPDGTPLAFQRYVPCRAGRGLSLDAMRRERRGPNGVNERMIVDVVMWAKEHGIDAVSLNFAFFRAWLDDGAELSRLQSVETWFVRRFNPYFQIESLLTFNAKFRPRWVARHLVYRTVGDLAPVSLAAMAAEAFLPFDRRHDDTPAPFAA